MRHLLSLSLLFSACILPQPGGGNGGGAGGSSAGSGGGAGGGGSATGLKQEVVSGSRLRAIYMAGDDGSSAALFATFWDTQLMTYCSPDAVRRICYPLRTVRPYFEAYYFSDPACTDGRVGVFSNDLAPIMVDAGFPEGNAYFETEDGGVYTLVPSPSYYRDPGTGSCTPRMPGGPTFAPGSAVPLSAFASMAIRRE